MALLICIAGLFIYLTVDTSTQYFEEVNQGLHGNLAEAMVHEVKPLVDGEVDTNAIQDIMHSMMVINPSVEVYLLDTTGGIITYVAPKKRVKVDQVDLAPIKSFLNGEQRIIKGDDPRNPDINKVFSAAPITDEGALAGYVYIILASEEQASAMSMLRDSYILQIGSRTIIIAILFALILGVLAFFYLTNSLQKVITSVRRFKEGDHSARVQSSGDFEELGDTFNAMADSITENINKLKSLDKLRGELIANVSHDLRTPLSIVSGYVETLLIKEDLGNEEKKKYLQLAFDSCDNLSKLIDQLFEYSKLEAAEIKPEKEAFSLAEIIQDIILKFQMPAEEKGISVQMNAGVDLPLVFADLALVERAISNLVDNAIKYGKQNGEVNITLENNRESVTVKVSDDGPGIPYEEQSYIFERYRRGERLNGIRQGSGLGLAIVKRILEIHDQSISILSESGKGASFIFKLPVQSAY